jgi:transcriptional regulator with XRE-family HTH domain
MFSGRPAAEGSDVAVGDDSDLDSPAAVTYARRVGQRLRAIRRQKRLSLQEVEAASGQEFKASVLGAYERGERVISVPRLQRLAGFYNVPVDQLLPRDAEPSPPAAGDGAPVEAAVPSPRKITFDLSRFQQADLGPEVAMVHQYLASIQVLRQDFNGRVLTIRQDDIRAIAGLFGTDADALVRRLDDLHLRLQSV